MTRPSGRNEYKATHFSHSFLSSLQRNIRIFNYQ